MNEDILRRLKALERWMEVAKTHARLALIATAAAVTTPNAASTAGTSTDPAHRDHTHRSPGGFASITAPVTVTNVTEVQLIGATIPAGLLAVGSTIRITAAGTGGTNGTGGPTLTWNMRIGPNTLTGTIPASVQIAPTVLASGKSWWATFVATVVTAGALGTIIGEGSVPNQIGNTIAFALGGSTTTATVAVDTTVPNVCELTFQWGANHANNTITAYVASIEVVKM